MDRDLQELLELIVSNMATKDDIQNLRGDMSQMEKKLTKRLDQHDERFDKLEEKANDMIAININLENNLTTRLDALTDGYKTVHEKQWALEHKMEALEKRLEILELKMA